MKILRPTPQDYDELLTVWEASVRSTHYSLNIFSEIPFYILSLYISYLRIFSFGLHTHKISRF